MWYVIRAFNQMAPTTTKHGLHALNDEYRHHHHWFTPNCAIFPMNGAFNYVWLFERTLVLLAGASVGASVGAISCTTPELRYAQLTKTLWMKNQNHTNHKTIHDMQKYLFVLLLVNVNESDKHFRIIQAMPVTTANTDMLTGVTFRCALWWPTQFSSFHAVWFRAAVRWSKWQIQLEKCNVFCFFTSSISSASIILFATFVSIALNEQRRKHEVDATLKWKHISYWCPSVRRTHTQTTEHIYVWQRWENTSFRGP